MYDKEPECVFMHDEKLALCKKKILSTEIGFRTHKGKQFLDQLKNY
jgi:hypothetical protein